MGKNNRRRGGGTREREGEKAARPNGGSKDKDRSTIWTEAREKRVTGGKFNERRKESQSLTGGALQKKSHWGREKEKVKLGTGGGLKAREEKEGRKKCKDAPAPRRRQVGESETVRRESLQGGGGGKERRADARRKKSMEKDFLPNVSAKRNQHGHSKGEIPRRTEGIREKKE